MDYCFPSVEFFQTGWKHLAVLVKKQQDAVFAGQGIYSEVAQLGVCSSFTLFLPYSNQAGFPVFLTGNTKITLES